MTDAYHALLQKKLGKSIQKYAKKNKGDVIEHKWLPDKLVCSFVAVTAVVTSGIINRSYNTIGIGHDGIGNRRTRYIREVCRIYNMYIAELCRTAKNV